MSTTAHSVSDRVNDMISYVQSGRILDAMTEFYHEDAAMQENGKEPTVGLAANIEREKQFLAQVKDFHAFDVTSIGIDGEGSSATALVESRMEFTNQEDKRVVLEQVSVQKWNDGKITHERFYYDSGA